MIATIGSVQFILLEKHPSGKKILPKRRKPAAAHEGEALTCHRQSRAAAMAGREESSLLTPVALTIRYRPATVLRSSAGEE